MRPSHPHMPPNLAAIAGLALILAACSDSIPTPPTARSVQPRIAQQRHGPKRMDTPWRGMSDSVLAAKVGEAGGRVFIGFKDPDAEAGVDEFGQVLASPGSITAGKALLRSQGSDFEIEFTKTPSVVTRIPTTVVAALRHNPLIEYIEPIFPVTVHTQSTTWNVQRVQAPTAWSYSTGSGSKLLILDTGVPNSHPDLSPAVIQSCESPPGTGLDQYGHGTNVAGVAAAVNNGIQIVGTAYGVALWSSKVSIGSTNQIDLAYATCGVQFGRTNHVQVINMSFGGDTNYTALNDQINGAYYQDNIVLVASAGNDYQGPVLYPARLDAVIAVSATNYYDNLAYFSNVGPEVELTAPGEGVESTCLGGSTCYVNGTSFSAPHVAAAAAILMAYNPSWSSAVVRHHLSYGATDLGAAGRDTYYGNGLLNIPAAINAPPPLYVSISGPGSVKTVGNYTWTCSASGGVGGYSYLWERSDNSGPYYTAGTGTSYSDWVDTSDGPGFDLRCSVTSGTQTVAAERSVAVILPP